MTSLTSLLYTATAALPDQWDAVAAGNIFLSRAYLTALEASAPSNMQCRFVGFFKDGDLCGVLFSQFLDLNQLESFGERDNCLKTTVRNFVFRNFASHVLFIGNNMLTGPNAFAFSETVADTEIGPAIASAIGLLKEEYRKAGQRVHIVSVKDFTAEETDGLAPSFPGYFRFTTQPNMIFTIPKDWTSIEDYVAALHKKYRDQFKRAHKRAEGVEKRRLDLHQIRAFEDTMHELYSHVARHAPFNTFFLPRDHFRVLKEKLGDRFLVYGYFLDGKLVGFNTLIRNGRAMDTYFLGYDDHIQKDKMLYLNMLYDMIGYSVKKGYESIVFSRTALEIKSSVGAQPLEMFGLIRHSNPLVNRYIGAIFRRLDPTGEWHRRHPFK